MGDKRKLSPVADEAPIEEKRIKKSKHDKKKKKEEKSKDKKKAAHPVVEVKDGVEEVKKDDTATEVKETQSESPAEPSEPQADDSKEVKKSKKAKKSKNKKNKEGEASTEDKTSNKEDASITQQETEESQDASQHKSSARFIVFVGNLPFNITQEQVQAHFAKIRPTQVRLATEKNNKKSRGFAFVEFDNYDRMKTCLKLYHHSQLDDAKGNARKINCELSAGGGGKSEYRKQKIQYKNERLAAQRANTAQLAQITKKKKEKREQFEGKSESIGIHPDRMRQVYGA
ncbi:hypothetical protein KEM56_000223 [Ascosphaera pollenicola]|nr:hypothetical protein KEM56_000223 [Ascosphaera pollenicola]